MKLSLSNRRSTRFPFFAKKKYLASLTSLVMLSMSITACQSTNISSQSTSLTGKNGQKPNITTARDLVSYSMLHRFDQSYDYQKSTKYQVDTLYKSNDIENKDNSIFLTMLKSASGDTKFPKTRNITPKVAECEKQYTDSYTAILDKITTQNASINPTADSEITTAQNNYELCLKNAEKESELEDSKNADTSNSEFTSIAGIIASQTPDTSYQTTVKKISDYFNALADNNAQDTSTNEDEDKDSDAKTDDEKNPFGIPPKKILKSDDGESDSSEDSKSQDGEEDNDNYHYETPANKALNTLRNLRITPEQIKVLNDTILSPKTLQYQGSYDKTTGQLSSVLVESNDNTYNQAYKRVPMLVDFGEMSITLEPDAALPMASFLSDKELPKNLAGKSIKFVLPENLRQNIPLPILKDSLIQAIGKAYGDIDEEKFTETVMDDYGKSLHASRAVKINLSTQDVGYLLGRTLKYWSQSLASVRQQHPEYIKNDSKFGATLDLLASANRIYRADDLAKLAQFLEAIVPISYNSFNYYYFDNNNQLVGYRKIRDYSSSLLSARGKSITTSQINYRIGKNTNQHLYYQPNPKDVIDGNALLEKITGEKKLKAEAQDARFGYADVGNSSSDSTDSNNSNNSSDSKLDCTETAIANLETIADKSTRVALCSINHQSTEDSPTNDDTAEEIPEKQPY